VAVGPRRRSLRSADVRGGRPVSESGTVGRRWGAGLCAAAVLLGGLAVVVGLQRMSGVGDRVGDFPAVAAGRERLVTFDDAGGKTAYYESTCFDCGDGGNAIVPDLEITSEDGDGIDVDGYATDGTATPSYTGGFFSYTRGQFDGEPEYTFRIPEPGTYRVQVGSSDAPDGQMRLGPSVTRTWFSGLVLIGGGVTVGGVLLVAGVVVLLVAGARRRRWRRQALPGPASPLGP